MQSSAFVKFIYGFPLALNSFSLPLFRALPQHRTLPRDPHWNTRRFKEAIHIRLQPNNINRDSGIEIPETWIPTIKKKTKEKKPTTTEELYDSGQPRKQHAEHRNSEDRNAPITAVETQPIAVEHPALQGNA